MNKNHKIWFILLILAIFLLAFSAAILAAYTFHQPIGNFPFRVIRPGEVNLADIELFYIARSVFSTINIALLVVLIATYANIYIKTKSEFTVGLLIFSVFLLIKDLAWSPFVIGAFGFGMFGLGPFAFLPDLFEMGALAVLLYLSLKY